MSLRVLLIFQHLRHENERGGQRSREIAEALVDAGFNVTAIIPNVDPLTEKVAISNLKWPWRLFSTSSGYDEYRYYVPATPRKGLVGRLIYSLFSFWNALLFVFTRLGKYDVVITTTHPLLMSLVALPAKWINRAKLIVEVRDIPLSVAIERGIFNDKSIASKLYRLFEGSLFQQADRVVSYSLRMVGILKSYYQLPPYQVLPIGVSEGSKKLDDLGLMKTCDQSFKFCFFGTLGTVLSLKESFELISQLNSCGVKACFDIYGDGESKEELENYVRDKNYKNICFRGVVPKGDVTRICSVYDFAYYPVEGGQAVAASLGNKFFDYLASETAMVVFGKDSEVADIIKKYNVGIAGDSAEELKGKIIEVLKCSKSEMNYSLNEQFNFDGALKQFSKEKIINVYLNLITDVCNE